MDASALLQFLDTNDFLYQRVEHPAVFTCEEAKRLVPHLQGAETKNLFLRDGKGRKHFLLAVSPETNVDLKALSTVLNAGGLSLASSERLKKYLGIEPGSVTLLGLINDTERNVEVLVDEELWKNDSFLCHPLVNTSTLVLSKDMLLKFFTMTGHSPKIVPVPRRDA